MNTAPGFAKHPNHSVTFEPTSARVVARSGDTLIADTVGAIVVHESRHTDVLYVPREDVRMDALHATDSSTYCPFKGHASYWSITAADAAEDAVWSYETPFDE